MEILIKVTLNDSQPYLDQIEAHLTPSRENKGVGASQLTLVRNTG